VRGVRPVLVRRCRREPLSRRHVQTSSIPPNASSRKTVRRHGARDEGRARSASAPDSDHEEATAPLRTFVVVTGLSRWRRASTQCCFVPTLANCWAPGSRSVTNARPSKRRPQCGAAANEEKRSNSPAKRCDAHVCSGARKNILTYVSKCYTNIPLRAGDSWRWSARPAPSSRRGNREPALPSAWHGRRRVARRASRAGRIAVPRIRGFHTGEPRRTCRAGFAPNRHRLINRVIPSRKCGENGGPQGDRTPQFCQNA
jgi:hypothetical protein